MKLDKIQDEIEDSKIIWHGHVRRMNAESMARQAMEYRLEGKRARGQPRYSCEEQEDLSRKDELNGWKW